MRNMTHSTLLRVGWAAVWLGVLVQLTISTLAAGMRWQGRCFQDIEYTFVPLLWSCGPPSALDLSLGWIATGLTLLGPALGITCAVLSALVARTSPRTTPLLRSVWLAGTVTLVVLGATLCYFQTRSPQPWGVSAWIWFVAVTMLMVLVASCFVYGITLTLVRRQTIANRGTEQLPVGSVKRRSARGPSSQPLFHGDGHL